MAKKKVLIHHDSAPAHTSVITVVKLHELRFKLLLHPFYSSDLASTNFFLFPKFKTRLTENKVSSNEEVIAAAKGFFADLLESEGNTLDLHVNGIKEECLDRSCDLSSKLKVDETRKPISFSLVKYENEQEENLLDLHETGINREIMDHSCDLTSEIKVDKNPVPFYLWEKCEVKKEDEVEYSSFADIEDAWNFEMNSFNIKEEVSIDEHEVGMQSIRFYSLRSSDDSMSHQDVTSDNSRVKLDRLSEKRAKIRKHFPHKCGECGKGFITPSKLKRHSLVHTGEKPHMCELCMGRFKSMEHLKRHLIIHSEEKAYDCSECGKRFTRLDRLKAHSLVHTSEESYACNKCGKSFNIREALRRHMLIHAEEKPLMCSKCSRRFCHRTALLRHEFNHTGEKPYVCKVCGVGFVRVDGLKIHAASHSEQKPYICKICSKGFTSSNVLRKHTLIHGVKSYKSGCVDQKRWENQDWRFGHKCDHLSRASALHYAAHLRIINPIISQQPTQDEGAEHHIDISAAISPRANEFFDSIVSTPVEFTPISTYDYRRLNVATIPDKYPIPHIHDVTQRLNSCTIFSTLDLTKAYHQVPIAPDDRAKSAVITPSGLFEFNRLREHGLSINLSKCTFGAGEVNYLGYTINKRGFRALEDRIKTIAEYPKPKTIADLRKFLGIINFYRRFLRNAAQIQAPLRIHLHGAKKNDKCLITCDREAEEAFELCKQQLAKATLLVHPWDNATLALRTDASDISSGAVLEQYNFGCSEPLGFFSKKHTNAEIKYRTYDRELLAICKSFKYFRCMVEGRRLIIVTDHKPLIHAFNQSADEASPRQLRHLDFISQFTTQIIHVKGADNIVADCHV
ncbi:hypothetical protein ANN_10845 [Periplaneta americana]|uniref:C2H2-type domain-containing protein n=1 Tax=Periplaneta americana TaxID=6978 RepID=A0ABQ8T3D6_PERAM|nr:hypothetical protein ANN_10845 [Periplaneta americana]